MSMSIECELYDGQLSTCDVGTFNASGTGPGGACHACPSHLESSELGATTVGDCFTIHANAFVVSDVAESVTAFDADSREFHVVREREGVKFPVDIAFITVTTFLVAMFESDVVILMNVEGEVIKDFVVITSPHGVLHIDDLNLVAISDLAIDRIYFFSLEDSKSEQPMQHTDAESFVSLQGFGAGAKHFVIGENPDEIIITTFDSNVVRMCIPGTACNENARNGAILYYWGNEPRIFNGIGVLRREGGMGTYVIAVRGNDINDDMILECALNPPSGETYTTDCEVFATKPGGSLWDPYSIVVDDVREILYVSDYTYNRVHVYSWKRTYLGAIDEFRGDLYSPQSMDIKPGPLAKLSPVSPPSSASAGVPFVTAITLRKSNNEDLPPSYPIEDELHRFQISATGFLTGTNHTTTITGEVLTAAAASIKIDFAGVWTVSITEGLLIPQHLHGSPYEIVLEPSPTDPQNCASNPPASATAGEPFEFSLGAFDAYDNPTRHVTDAFEAFFDGDAGTKFLLTRGPDGAFGFSHSLTVARSYRLHVFHTTSDTEVTNSPFHFDVDPASPHKPNCKHSLVGLESFDPSQGLPLLLQVFAFDEFDNAVVNSDKFFVAVDGEMMDSNLVPPTYIYEHTFPSDQAADVKFGFLYEGQGHLPGSPVTIVVATPVLVEKAGLPVAAIGGGLAALLALFGAVYWRQAKKAGQERAEMQEQRLDLAMENHELHKSLRRKKHSEVELEVMQRAMDELDDDRADELRSVLIHSSEVKIEMLLGQGGMGKVHLATVRGQKVAVKQLLAINEENVMRFR